MDGYQKLSRVYDSLRKSAKFTAAQKKETQENFVDCVGSLVAYCEKEGGKIPKFEIETDYDIIDTVINDKEEAKKKGQEVVEVSDEDYQAHFENIEKDYLEDEKIYYDNLEKEES